MRNVLLLAVAITIVGSAMLAIRQPQPPLSDAQVLFESPRSLPGLDQLALIDAERQSISADRLFRERWSLLYTGYLNCPDLCPTTLAQLAQMHTQLSAVEAQQIQIVFVSIDPARDQPAAVARYSAAFSPAILPLTGSLEQLHRLTDTLGFIDPPRQSAGSVGHSSAVAMIDPGGRLVGLFRQPHDIQQMTRVIRSVL